MSLDALRVTGLVKEFPGTRALDGVDLVVAPGEIHALVGANGSGKSTLIKILAGVHQGDAGEIEVPGERLAATDVTPGWAFGAGLGFVHQDLGLIEGLTVAENLFLGMPYPRRRGRIDWRGLYRTAAEMLDRLDIAVGPGEPLASLRASDRTLVAIGRAVRGREELHTGTLVLDEPTAKLAAAEVRALLRALRGYAAKGQSILYVSHRLDEVLACADRVTVLRDGRVVASTRADDLGYARLANLIAGHELAARRADDREAGRDDRVAAARGDRVAAAGDDPMAAARDDRVAAAGDDPMAAARDDRVAAAEQVLVARGLCAGALAGIDLTVAPGEVVGLAGLVGSGRSTLLKALFGAQPRTGGEVVVAGRRLPPGDVAAAVDAGVGYVPEDRAREGAFLRLEVRENLSASRLRRHRSRGALRLAAERRASERSIERFRVRCTGPSGRMALLSGGNQQKVVLARWLASATQLLLLDEPTQGVDVGARAEIYGYIREAVRHDLAVIVASSDTDELIELCDRVLVLAGGRIVAEARGEQITHHWLADHVYGHDFLEQR